MTELSEQVEQPLAELIEQLREEARQDEAAYKMLAEAKTARQADRGDYPELDGIGYDWLRAEQTSKWKAAAALEASEWDKAALREALDRIWAVISDTPELNMSNFDIEEVASLNDGMIEIWKIVEAARTELKGTNP